MSRLSAHLRYRILRSPAASLIKQARRTTLGPVLARRVQLAAQLPCGPEVRAHAALLARDGHVRLDALIDREALRAMAEAADARRPAPLQAVHHAPLPEGTSNKAFWSRLLDGDLEAGRMPADSPFTRFALQPRVLGMLAATFGTLPLLDYVLLTLSRPTSGDLAQSQLWHRDHDDVRTIKLFVYLTDVNCPADGPFSFLPGPVSDRIGPVLRSHSRDDFVFVRAKRSEMEQVFAPRLSCFAVETSRCLHMGSRVGEGHERLLFTATYTTAPRIFASGNRFTPVNAEDALDHAVLGQDLA